MEYYTAVKKNKETIYALTQKDCLDKLSKKS